MIKAGVTGSLGSGKSTVCSVFASFGIPVFNADLTARELMNSNDLIKKELIRHFGHHIYTQQGLNRNMMAQLIFSDKVSLDTVNSIVHPVVKENFDNWCIKHHASVYVIKEAAVIIETGGYRELDKTILVTAPEATKIKRVQKRDKRSTEEIKNILANQLPDEKKIPFADFIIENDDKKLILPTIIEIHHQLLKMTS